MDCSFNQKIYCPNGKLSSKAFSNFNHKIFSHRSNWRTNSVSKSFESILARTFYTSHPNIQQDKVTQCIQRWDYKSFLDVQSDDSSPPFPLDRRKLKIALYEKWYQGFTNRVSSWPIQFFPSKNHLIAAFKMNFTHQLTQIITGHYPLNYFLNKIGKGRSGECICGENETCNHFLFTCPVYFLQHFGMKLELHSLGINFPFCPSSVISDKLLRKCLNRFLYSTRRLVWC